MWNSSLFNQEVKTMQKKYGVLRFISGFYKVVAIIIAVLTLLSALGICVTSVLGTPGLTQAMQSMGLPAGFGAGSVVAGIVSALVAMIGGAISALGLYAVGELISLLINMEENTRATAALLQYKQPVQPPQPSQQAFQPVQPVQQ
jgi:hypothetical protein